MISTGSGSREHRGKQECSDVFPQIQIELLEQRAHHLASLLTLVEANKLCQLAVVAAAAAEAAAAEGRRGD